MPLVSAEGGDMVGPHLRLIRHEDLSAVLKARPIESRPWQDLGNPWPRASAILLGGIGPDPPGVTSPRWAPKASAWRVAGPWNTTSLAASLPTIASGTGAYT